MNKRQKKNLDKLIAYVEGLPKTYKRFDMSEFCTNGDGGLAAPAEATDAIHTCGTAACFLGHGPAAGIRAKRGEDWWEYMERQFGTTGADESTVWLFSPDWRGRNGTKAAAVKRAKEFVAAGYQVTDTMRKKMDRLGISFF